MRRIYEKKDHLIRKNPNLTDEQKQEIIEVLGKHPSYENKIDWNKSNSLTYEDFLSILRPLYINDLDPRGLIEGEDYNILYESEDEVLYSIYSYDASRILASNNVEPEMWTKLPSWCGEKEFTDEAHAFGHFDSEHGDMKPGAKWCISMQTSDEHWNQYSQNIHFFFWFRNDDSLGDNRKIAIGVSKRTWEVALIYNGADKDTEMELPSHIMEAIKNEREVYKEKKLNSLKSRFESKLKLNPQTNRYDYDGDLDRYILKDFTSEDGDGFIINFGKVTGNFECLRLGLKSLKGAPQKVEGDFSCSFNQLTSLEGTSRDVGKNFYCSGNQLTSLEGAPKRVGKDFYCNSNQLTSLEGAPKRVGGGFDCSSNKLKSLKGAPQKIGRNFICSGNQLISLEGAPQEIGGSLYCDNNQLISLEGAPQIVGGNFICSENQLTSLEGAPQAIGQSFYCNNNQLTSLEGAPTEVRDTFDCSKNKLTSLKGAPRKVGRYFNCRSNPSLHSLDGIGDVGKRIYKNF